MKCYYVRLCSVDRSPPSGKWELARYVCELAQPSQSARLAEITERILGRKSNAPELHNWAWRAWLGRGALSAPLYAAKHAGRYITVARLFAARGWTICEVEIKDVNLSNQAVRRALRQANWDLSPNGWFCAKVGLGTYLADCDCDPREVLHARKR